MVDPRPCVDVVAYYLPQFYPLALNSRHWGEGYTEWNAVLASQRGFRSPSSSRLSPGELGFYDLRSDSVRRRQAELAQEHNISAFAVYHYWSLGDRVMPEVVDNILRDGQPDVPFFFCWANHDWTLAWKGLPEVVTWRQEYDENDNNQHIDWLINCFKDSRYYKIAGYPVVAVYAPTNIPEWRAISQRWRSRALALGFPGLIVLGVAPNVSPPSAASWGLDAWIQSPGAVVGRIPRWRRAISSITKPKSLVRFAAFQDYTYNGRLIARALREARRKSREAVVPAVICTWNNAGRRRRSAWSMETSPKDFAVSLTEAIHDAPLITPPGAVAGRRLVFVNAWNEWGEGMALEPSVEHGRAYLEALRDSVT